MLGFIMPNDQKQLDLAKHKWLNGWSVEEKDNSFPTKGLDLSKVSLGNMLWGKVFHVNGEWRLHLIRNSHYYRLTAEVFMFLWSKKHLIPEEWKQDGVIITFDGTIFVNNLGTRCVITMWWSDIENKWFCDLKWLGRNFTAKHMSALLRAD